MAQMLSNESIKEPQALMAECMQQLMQNHNKKVNGAVTRQTLQSNQTQTPGQAQPPKPAGLGAGS